METARSEIKFPPPALGVRPLSPALGAEILGIDLRDDIDARVFADAAGQIDTHQPEPIDRIIHRLDCRACVL